MSGLWEAVEVGVDEWFLGRRDGDGYDPFLDLANMDRGQAEYTATEMNRIEDAVVAAERKRCAGLVAEILSDAWDGDSWDDWIDDLQKAIRGEGP